MTERSRHDDAGVAAAAPASSSARSAPDVVPEPARTELERVRRRWSELTPARAEGAAPLLRAVVTAAAARTAPDKDVPNLGPPLLGDLLAVVVWDAYASGRGDGLAEALTALRRALP